MIGQNDSNCAAQAQFGTDRAASGRISGGGESLGPTTAPPGESVGYNRASTGFDIALRQLKNGRSVSRHGWNGPGQRVFLWHGEDDSDPSERASHFNAIPATLFRQPPRSDYIGRGPRVMPYLRIVTTQGHVATWVPSITDLLAEDWFAL